MPEPDETVAAARHGSYCPKMCNFACPVTAATGRDDAMPWSFHRTVVDLVDGALAPGPAAHRRLSACSGCLACQVPCEFDQDVPDQVRHGRTLLADNGAPLPAAEEAVSAVANGRSPFGHPPIADVIDRGAGTAVLAGCREQANVAAAAVDLLRAGGVAADLISPAGCCGAALDDLGAREAGDLARERLTQSLEGYDRVLLLDPHCLPAVEGTSTADIGHLVEELARLVEAGRLTFDASDRESITYHDACLLARRDAVVDGPRRLLRAAGAVVAEPEHAGTTTACSGGGLALHLVDPDAANATAERRRGELEAAAAHTVTACAGAQQRLAGEHLMTYLVQRLEERV